MWYTMDHSEGGVSLWAFLSGCLDLFDDTLRAAWGVPVLRFFLAAFVVAAGFGLTCRLLRTGKHLAK